MMSLPSNPNIMPSKSDRSSGFSGLPTVFCSWIWLLVTQDCPVCGNSSSCTLVNVCCILIKSFIHMRTHTSTRNFFKNWQPPQKGSSCNCQAWSKGTTGGKALVLLHHFSYVHPRQPGRIVKNRDPKSQTDWARIPALFLLYPCDPVHASVSSPAKRPSTVPPSWGCCEE